MYKVYYSINDTLCSSYKFFTTLLNCCIYYRKGNQALQEGFDLFVKHCIELDEKQCLTIELVHIKNKQVIYNTGIYYYFKKIIVREDNVIDKGEY